VAVPRWLSLHQTNRFLTTSVRAGPVQVHPGLPRVPEDVHHVRPLYVPLPAPPGQDHAQHDGDSVQRGGPARAAGGHGDRPEERTHEGRVPGGDEEAAAEAGRGADSGGGKAGCRGVLKL
jgi:hypothetical protein